MPLDIANSNTCIDSVATSYSAITTITVTTPYSFTTYTPETDSSTYSASVFTPTSSYGSLNETAII
jgi:hypothetical protein